VRYRVGEGITGQVVESGKPIVVPRVSREPALLNRAARRGEASRQELSFICVPIVLHRAAPWPSRTDARAGVGAAGSSAGGSCVSTVISEISLEDGRIAERRDAAGLYHAPPPLLANRRHLA
jgi:hypothetical protein